MRPDEFNFAERMAHYVAKAAMVTGRSEEEERLWDAAYAGDQEARATVLALSEQRHRVFEARPKRRLDRQERKLLKATGGCGRGCRIEAWVYLDQPSDRVEIRGTHNGQEFSTDGDARTVRDDLRFRWMGKHVTTEKYW